MVLHRKPNDQMGPKLYRALDVTNTGVVERYFLCVACV